MFLLLVVVMNADIADVRRHMKRMGYMHPDYRLLRAETESIFM